MLSAVAQVILRLAPPRAAAPLLVDGLGLVLVVGGIAAMVAVARFLTRRAAALDMEDAADADNGGDYAPAAPAP